MIFANKRLPSRDNDATHDNNANKANRGAITVEYALGMLLVAGFMMSIERLFRYMAIDIIKLFKELVTTFPDI